MTAQRLFIPDRIKVGFQNRGDTYTKKLAYVIYYDQKGKLRKETSWQSWRDKKINPVECENVPTDGFVLNKGVGGQRHSYGWHARNEYIRVYDPRDFEFEISVANLLFILRECDCSRGKGLEGKFVYAWNGTELILLPEGSVDYQESKKHTDLMAKKVKGKELIPGATYMTKDQKTWVYVGRFDYYAFLPSTKTKGTPKRYVFWNGKTLECLDSLKNIAQLHSDSITPDYAALVDLYNKTENASPVKSLHVQKEKDSEFSYWKPWVYEETPGVYVTAYYNSGWYGGQINTFNRIYLKDGLVVCEDFETERYKDKNHYNYHWYRYNGSSLPWIEPTQMALYAERENGVIHRVTGRNRGY